MSDTKSVVIPTLTNPTILPETDAADDKSSKALHAMYRVKLEQLKKEHGKREAGWIEEKIDLSMALESAKKQSTANITDQLAKQRERLLAQKNTEIRDLEAEIKAQYEEKLEEHALAIQENIQLINALKHTHQETLDTLEHDHKKALDELEYTNKKQGLRINDLEIKNKDLAFQLESLQSANLLDLSDVDIQDKPYLTTLKQLSDKVGFLELECAYQVELSAVLSNKDLS
ncbi:MAG: hypothetical protein OXE99_01370 [Cellvibrionales bacterium]|nr:hypothetical protein [Cellvibrionales bacterium]